MNGPNFFIAGAPKCGTTSWSMYLAEHDQIERTSQSEPHFFSSDLSDYQITKELDEYLNYFSATQEIRVRFDCSPLYLYSVEAANRIYEFNPDAKILLLLREQASFLPSWHNQLLYSLNENIRDFGVAWRRSGRRGKQDIPVTCRVPRLLDYKAVGSFAPGVNRFLDLFGPEKLRVAWMEDWRSDPAAFYAYLLEYLGLPRDGRTEFMNVNPAHRNRSAWIGRISHRPPRWLSRAVALSKSVVGARSYGIGALMLRWNRAAGASNRVPTGLAEEISEIYAAENRELRAKLTALGCLYIPARGSVPKG